MSSVTAPRHIARWINDELTNDRYNTLSSMTERIEAASTGMMTVELPIM